MAKFCNQCGRPLKEGEVCNCTGQQQAGNAWQQPNINHQQPYRGPQNGPQNNGPQGGFQGNPRGGFQRNPWGPQGGYGPQGGPGYQKQYQVPPQVTDFMAEFKLFFLRFLPFIKDPIGELRNTYQRNNFSSGLYMFLADFLMMLLYLIVLCVRISIMIKSKLNNMSYGAYGYFSGTDYDPGIPYFRIIFGVLLFMAIYHFAATGILCGFSKLFSKNRISFAQTMTVTGSIHWYMCFFLILAVLLTIIHPIAGAVILGIGVFFTQFLGIITFCELVPMKSSNKLYTWVIYAILKAIVLSIMYAILFSTLESLFRAF